MAFLDLEDEGKLISRPWELELSKKSHKSSAKPFYW
jgi:hypothetical protein